jgi:hypothetical protein
MAEATMVYSENENAANDWAGFSLRRLLQRVAAKRPYTNDQSMGAWTAILSCIKGSEVSIQQLTDAKTAGDEVGYLRLLQSSPKLRRAVLELGC